MKNGGWRRAFRFRDSRVEHDVDEEFSFHFAMRVEQFMAQGMSREAAERAAHEQFGNEREVRSTLVDLGRRSRRRRDWRDTWDNLVHDLVVAIRALRREPLFALGVILTIGLGIGANATMFGIIDGLMLRGPAHVVDARHVERLYITALRESSGRIQTGSTVGWVTYATLRDRATSFAGVGGYSNPYPRSYGVERDAPFIPVAPVTWDLFPTLGVRPLIGRFFNAEEDQPPGGAYVAVVSARFWRTEMGGSSSALGKRIQLGPAQFTVIGVAPAGFTGPDRVPVDVWVPMSLTQPVKDWPTSYRAQWMRVVARLKPDIAPATANAEVTTLLRGAYTGQSAGMTKLVASVRPIWYGPNGQITAVANVSRWLMGVAAIVLLITCANVANLLLARARRRRREVAVRVALGAGSGRVARFVLTETIVLAFVGTLVALVVALAGGRLMRATLLSNVAWEGTGIDGRVFAFTLAVTLFAVVIVGIVPVLDAARVSVSRALKASDRGGTAARTKLRTSLSVVQAALCVVLLIGAGLFVESLSRSRRVNLGFQPDRVVRVLPRYSGFGDLPKEQVAAARERRRQEVAGAIDRLRALPLVEHVAVAAGTPFGNSFGVDLKIPGRDSIPQLPGGGPFISAVSPDYFATFGTPLRRGRLFNAQDTPEAALVTVINETMAQVLWPGEDALGKCILIDSPRCAQVVGIVADVHQSGLREPPSMQYYVPLGQERGFGGSVFLVRPRGDVQASMASIRDALLSLREMPAFSLETMQEVVDPEFRPWKLGAAMFGVFGALALLVASVGLYSVIAYLVTDRTRELGVRIALGASGGRILREVVLTGLSTTTVGVALGIGVALLSARFIEPLLFDTSAKSPSVYAGVAVLVLVIAALAAWSPARRASRVDPVIALRAD